MCMGEDERLLLASLGHPPLCVSPSFAMNRYFFSEAHIMIEFNDDTLSRSATACGAWKRKSEIVAGSAVSRIPVIGSLESLHRALFLRVKIAQSNDKLQRP
jgi:hypothetical protein